MQQQLEELKKKKVSMATIAKNKSNQQQPTPKDHQRHYQMEQN